MTWHETEDPEQWLAAVGGLLLPEPGRNTIALTVVEHLRGTRDGTRFAWWHDGSDVTGAALQSPGFPVLLCTAPDEAVRPFVELWEPTWISGTTALAVQTAKIAARGRDIALVAAERLFRLGDLIHPDVPGEARLATVEDTDLLISWFEAFTEEAKLAVQLDARAEVPPRIARGSILVWEHDGPRAMGGHQPPAFGGMRVGPIYTPPEHRGHGYGGAVTAAVSQRGLDLGASEVVLHTDLANPTSNALYPRLGYRVVEDRAVLRISS
jgi:RimJ/RimL family protein N-acetyltransferase